MGITRFFKQDEEKGTEYFIGDKLEIFISKRYENHRCINIGNTLSTIAVFDMIVNDKYEDALFATCIVEMEPSLIEEMTIDGSEFIKATFFNGDVFIKNINVQQIQELGFVIFYEVITQANRSKHLDYRKIVKIFDVLTDVAGINFNISRSTFEMICAHLHRNPEKLSEFYRQTLMDKPAAIIAFRDIAHGAVTTTGKMIGNYFTDSIRSAMVNPSDDSSELENIMRS